MIGLVLQLLLLAQSAGTSQPTATDVLKAAKNGVIDAQSVSYVVIRDYTDSSGVKSKGRTKVSIVKSPFGFRAEHRRDDGSHSKTSVSDGKTTNTISDGKQDQEPTFGSEGSGAMITESDGTADVASTWHVFLDPEYVQRAIESGRTMYLWEDEVQSDPCSVIVYAGDHSTDYFWFSTKTGLPRATQRLSMRRGRPVLSVRYEISGLTPRVLPGREDKALGDAVGVENPADDLSGVVDGSGTCALEVAGAGIGRVEGLDVAIGETDKTVVDDVWRRRR